MATGATTNSFRVGNTVGPLGKGRAYGPHVYKLVFSDRHMIWRSHVRTKFKATALLKNIRAGKRLNELPPSRFCFQFARLRFNLDWNLITYSRISPIFYYAKAFVAIAFENKGVFRSSSLFMSQGSAWFRIA